VLLWPLDANRTAQATYQFHGEVEDARAAAGDSSAPGAASPPKPLPPGRFRRPLYLPVPVGLAPLEQQLLDRGDGDTSPAMRCRRAVAVVEDVSPAALAPSHRVEVGDWGAVLVRSSQRIQFQGLGLGRAKW
jgi:hypothetical protein